MAYFFNMNSSRICRLDHVVGLYNSVLTDLLPVEDMVVCGQRVKGSTVN